MSRRSFEHILLHVHFGLLGNNGSGQWQARQQRNPPAARKRQYFDILVEAVFMESFAVINILILSGYC